MKGVFIMLVIAVGVVILGVFGSALYTQQKTTGTIDVMLALKNLIPSPPEPVVEFDGSLEVISLFSNVSKINLDPSILENPGYKLLIENKVMPSHNITSGRNNPFLPVGPANQIRNSTFSTGSSNTDLAPLVPTSNTSQ